MTLKIVTIAALACALAACGSGTAPAPVEENVAQDAGLNYQAEVAALAPSQQNVVFLRAIRDAGLQCQGVESATESPAGSFNYAVLCQDGGKHQVAIAASGDAQVTSAASAR